MARFVHIAPKNALRSIRRAGIKTHLINNAISDGVYAMPVVLNFSTSHQWVRELKCHGQRQMYGVYFGLPDAEEIWVGRYNQPHQRMTAAQALGLFMHHANPQGYEVIIPHAITPTSITAIRELPHIGWRYFPTAHGQRPCGCPACQRRGAIKSRRIREAYEAQFGTDA